MEKLKYPRQFKSDSACGLETAWIGWMKVIPSGWFLCIMMQLPRCEGAAVEKH